MTKTYEAALNKANLATAIYGRVTELYRARLIDDAEYLAARKAYVEANKEFDAAFAIEAGH